MKYIDIKKNILGFKPEIHWKLILSSMFFLLCLGLIYDVYIYMYAEQQIRLTDTNMSKIDKATSTARVSMEDTFEIYKARKIVYDGIIEALATNRTITIKNIATSSK